MQSNLKVVRVEQVFVKENHDRWEELGKWDSIGMISYSDLNQPTPIQSQIKYLPIAKPLWSNITQIPTINELIYIVTAPSSTYVSNNSIDAYYFPPIGIHNTPNHNALPVSLKSKTNKLTNEEVIGGGINKAQEGDYYLDLGKDYRSIAYQVLAVMAMRVGAKISQKLKILMISNIRQDEWQYENSERRAVIDNLLDTLATYDARHPVNVTSRGLFEVIFNKDQKK